MSADAGFGWRPIDAGQVPAWASLIAAIEAVDHPDENLGEEYLLEEFADPRHDFPRGSVAVYDGPVRLLRPDLPQYRRSRSRDAAVRRRPSGVSRTRDRLGAA